jgi:hypothetical protein
MGEGVGEEGGRLLANEGHLYPLDVLSVLVLVIVHGLDPSGLEEVQDEVELMGLKGQVNLHQSPPAFCMGCHVE